MTEVKRATEARDIGTRTPEGRSREGGRHDRRRPSVRDPAERRPKQTARREQNALVFIALPLGILALVLAVVFRWKMWH
jgi:hypothetical protein